MTLEAAQRQRLARRPATPKTRLQGLLLVALVAVVAPILHFAISFSVQLLRPVPPSLGPHRTRTAGGLEARTLLRAARKKKVAAAAADEEEEKPKKKATRKKKTAVKEEETAEKPKKTTTRKKKAVVEEEEEAVPAKKTTKTAAKKAVKDDRDPNDFYAGDRVSAKYHRDQQWYEAIVLYKKDQDIWDVSWDEPDEGEQITSVGKSLIKLVKRGPVDHPDLERVPLAVGDQVLAYFSRDQKHYPALLVEEPKQEGGKYTVKWDDPDGCPPTADLERHDIKLKLRKV